MAKTVTVLYGGISRERDISIMSAENVIKSLKKLSYVVKTIDVGKDIVKKLLELKTDVIFNCLHGTYGEDGCIQGLLNLMNIPYTHSGVLSSSICFNKEIAKNICSTSNIKTPKYVVFDKNNIADVFAPPYIIKPISQGSSIGVKLILEKDKYNIHSDNQIFKYSNEIIIEEYVKGVELNVAVLCGKAYGVLEVKPKSIFYDYKSKYTQNMCDYVMYSKINQKKKKYLLSISENIFRSLKCRGIVRIEFIMCDKTEDIFFLEINTHPGMTSNHSICSKILNYYNISFEEMITTLVEKASCD